jgi:hypothetical protein
LYDEIAAFNYYNIRADELTYDDAFSITVVTDPVGYGNKIYLSNVGVNPGFREDSNDDGLADNWNEYALSETTSFNTTHYLTGAHSQQVAVGSSGNRGIYSDYSLGHTGTQWGEPFVAYAWVYRVSGTTDEIRMSVNGNNTGQRGYADLSNATQTMTDSAGGTWYKLEVTGTVGGGDGYFIMYILRISGSEATTFCVDRTYIQVGTDVMPYTEWVSCSLISSFYESPGGDWRAWTSADHEIPYLDVYGIRGDRPTYPDIWIKAASANQGVNVEFIKVTNSASEGVNDLDFFIEMTGDPDLNRSDGEYGTVSVDGSGWMGLGSTLTVNPVKPWVGEVIAMAPIYNTSTEDLEVRANFRYASEEFEDNFTETLYTVQGEWRLVTTGPINVQKLEYDTNSALARLEFKRENEDASAEDVYVDFVLFAPIDDGCVIFQLPDTLENCGNYCIINNENRQILTAQGTLDIEEWKISVNVTGRAITGFFGREIRLIPERANRMFIMVTRADNVHLSSTGEHVRVSLEYTPRTRFLLGDS